MTTQMNGLIPTHEDKLPQPGTFRALPSFRIHLLAGMSARHAELRFLQLFGLRMLEARVVGLVGAFGALSLKEICQESDIEKSHASKIIGRLVERGLVEKLGDNQDQRAISVRLTSEGQVLHRAIYTEAQQRNERWLSVLSERERAQLLASVEKLIVGTREMLGMERQESPLQEPSSGPASPGVALDLDYARRLHTMLGDLIDGAAGQGRGRA